MKLQQYAQNLYAEKYNILMNIEGNMNNFCSDINVLYSCFISINILVGTIILQDNTMGNIHINYLRFHVYLQISATKKRLFLKHYRSNFNSLINILNFIEKF